MIMHIPQQGTYYNPSSLLITYQSTEDDQAHNQHDLSFPTIQYRVRRYGGMMYVHTSEEKTMSPKQYIHYTSTRTVALQVFCDLSVLYARTVQFVIDPASVAATLPTCLPHPIPHV